MMECNGFKAVIKKAAKLKDIGRGHGLPLGTTIPTYSVDSFKHPLSSWVGGKGSYVIPVNPDWGLWFDWTMNDDLNTAILPTVKGMNPITGRRTEGFGLEQYKNKCPTHDIELKDNLFCEKCNFRLAAQNYVAAPNVLWWDGFRTSDGKVRQFFFTEDMAKSIPELVLGKNDTVPAFGFAFYTPKKPRIPPRYEGARGEIKCSDSVFTNNLTMNYSYILSSLASNKPDPYSGSICSTAPVIFSPTAQAASNTTNQVYVMTDVVDVGIGAGAEINQDLKPDLLSIEDWQEEPSAVIRLFFVFESQFKEIYAKGMKDFVGEKEGFLAGLPIG